MSTNFTEHDALEEAVRVGAQSPCAKSKRGVVIFHRRVGIVARGYNVPPPGFACDGSEACRAACRKVCNHAESEALFDWFLATRPRAEYEMLHVKVVGVGLAAEATAVSSGGPTCWQCSPKILRAGIGTMWLLLSTGLQRYTADHFHEVTLRNCGLPVIRAPQGERL
jgi:deoxycytidylate deaminase